MSKKIPKKTRELIIERARGRCEYCRSPVRFAIDNFSVEHIIPFRDGGASTTENLALSCQECNNHKYTKTTAPDPVSGDSAALFHPRKHRWQEHFTWNEDFTIVIGITPTGRASVEVLHLNRTGVVNLRRVLYAVNEHPPIDEDT